MPCTIIVETNLKYNITCINAPVYYSMYVYTTTHCTDNLVFIEIGDNRVILFPVFSLHKLQNTMKILSMLQEKVQYKYTWEVMSQGWFTPLYWICMLIKYTYYIQASVQPADLPRQLSGKSIAWKADGRGFESHLRQQFFFKK